MNRIEASGTKFAGAGVALVLLASTAALAAAPAAPPPEAPMIVAQSAGSRVDAPAAAATADAFPAYQRGVRKAAMEGNEALRRYVWRTRMIYNFRFEDYAKY